MGGDMRDASKENREFPSSVARRQRAYGRIAGATERTIVNNVAPPARRLRGRVGANDRK